MALEGDLELFRLPDILQVIAQQRNLTGANAVVGNAVAEEVLDEIHLVREQVAGVAGAVGVITAPVPEVAFVPGNLRGRAKPTVPVHVLLNLRRVRPISAAP